MLVTKGDLSAWRGVAQRGQVSRVTCVNCGCEYALGDGGTQINTVDKSQPSLASIGTATGPKAGGTAVALVGHAFDVGVLVVKFEGAAGTGLVVTDEDHAAITTPAAPRMRVRTGATTGVLTVGDTLTGSVSGETCTLAGYFAGGVLVENLSGALTVSEFLEKDAGNKIQVAAADIYAPCDVTVENENGSRPTGSRLVGAFTYDGFAI
jgi:hypothetical protein